MRPMWRNFHSGQEVSERSKVMNDIIIKKTNKKSGVRFNVWNKQQIFCINPGDEQHWLIIWISSAAGLSWSSRQRWNPRTAWTPRPTRPPWTPWPWRSKRHTIQLWSKQLVIKILKLWLKSVTPPQGLVLVLNLVLLNRGTTENSHSVCVPTLRVQTVLGSGLTGVNQLSLFNSVRAT